MSIPNTNKSSTPSPSSLTSEASSKPLDDLTALCKKWQKILKLEDWEICPHWADEGELENDNELANIFPVVQRKHACIYVLNPEAAEKLEGFPSNIESTILHELLHLHFALFLHEENPVYMMIEEQAIHAITGAFESVMEKK